VSFGVAPTSMVRDSVGALASGIILQVVSPDAVPKPMAASSISGSAAPFVLADVVTESKSGAFLFSPPRCD
jgi:hypothetical protein